MFICVISEKHLLLWQFPGFKKKKKGSFLSALFALLQEISG